VEQSEQQIRATVIGAGQYTLQVSGSTIFISRPDLLPHRNLQVVSPIMPTVHYTSDMVEESVRQALQRLDVEEGESPIALSFRWRMEPSYDRVRTLAQGIINALPNTIAQKIPLTLIFDTDIGGAVGSLLTRELLPGHDVVSVDEVQVSDLDYIDLAEERGDVHAVPVVVKSLVFTTARERSSGLIWGTAEAPHLHTHGQEHEHDHDHGHDHDYDHPHTH
jgi:ethanolamine utilization protein EutA